MATANSLVMQVTTWWRLAWKVINSFESWQFCRYILYRYFPCLIHSIGHWAGSRTCDLAHNISMSFEMFIMATLYDMVIISDPIVWNNEIVLRHLFGMILIRNLIITLNFLKLSGTFKRNVIDWKPSINTQISCTRVFSCFFPRHLK